MANDRSKPQSPKELSDTDIAILSPPSNPSVLATSYNVPNSNIRVVLIAKDWPVRPSLQMPAEAISNLIETGKIALDLLAQRAGGDTADLNVPSIRWAISGLAIQITDATTYDPHTTVPRARFDEIQAAYDGVGAAIRRIDNVEAGIRVFRRGSFIRRREEVFIGFGFINESELQDGTSAGNSTVATA
ncbi:MAG: hypothetical protein Q9196_007475 [Gyalolechia fulgens]